MNSPERNEYIKYRMERAVESLAEVQLLLHGEFWNAAVNRMYYACFYAVGALLIKHDILTSSHAGARQKFGQMFIATGLVDKRQRGDYADFFDIDEEIAVRLHKPSIELVEAINKLIFI
jgi:uncharacterized protein (UPF0332 family)